MVYDPIRDCEVPSPAVPNPTQALKPWELDTPRSSFSDDPRGGSQPPFSSMQQQQQQRQGSYGHGSAPPQHRQSYGGAQPPAWQQHASGGGGNGTSSPSMRPSRSVSGGLRSLMNDDVGAGSGGDDSRRSSAQTTYSEDEERQAAVYQSNRHALHHHQQQQQQHFAPGPSAPGISHSTSNSSLHSAGSASNMSPPARHRHLDAPEFLAPVTPASALPHRPSRSPYPPPSSMSPVSHQPGLPHHHDPAYGTYYDTPPQAGPSRSRRTSVSNGPRPMLPPGVPRHSDYSSESARSTPAGYSNALPLRSPSVSISPRSSYVGLPAGHASSRPTSSTSNTFYFHPPTMASGSPAGASRLLSEDPQARRYSEEPQYAAAAQSRPDSSGRRATVPAMRPSQTPSHSYDTPVRSPSPVRRRAYLPERRSSASMALYRPILPDEIARLRALGQSNNPLHERKRKRPPPSWAGTPRSQATPNEMDNSYFPQQAEQGNNGAAPANRRSASYVGQGRPSSSSERKPSATPGPSATSAAVLRTPGYDHSTAPMRTPGWEEFQQQRERELLTPSGSEVYDARQRRQASGSAQPQSVSVPQRADTRMKRSMDEDEDGHHAQRRKVSDMQHSGNAATVASHYNARANIGVDQREFSPIIGLKKFNNWIKSVLIGKFCHRPQGHHGGGARVLDIGCGKGGDLNKWKQARIGLYVGLDIADISIEQAVDRYRKMNRPGFDAYFFAHDCYSKPLSAILPEPLREIGMYDNVTMQFCMHYAFETAPKARMMIENVSRYLRTGGVFLGTIPDSDLLLQRLAALPEDDEELKFGNSCYFVQFQERHHKGLYGHQYRFYLSDAVDDVPEYIVDWNNFVQMASEYGLKLVYKKPFNDVLTEEQSSRDFGPLLSKMGVVNQNGDSAMDGDQWEAANLYMAFAFEKY